MVSNMSTDQEKASLAILTLTCVAKRNAKVCADPDAIAAINAYHKEIEEAEPGLLKEVSARVVGCGIGVQGTLDEVVKHIKQWYQSTRERGK